MSPGQPLHEVDFPLMLPGFGALAGSAFACKSHVPAFILYILQSRVVILQYYLGENAVLPLTVFLANQLSPPVHTDVEACFSSFNSYSTPKRVSLHYELGMNVSIICHGVDFLVRQNLHVLATGSTVKLVGPD